VAEVVSATGNPAPPAPKPDLVVSDMKVIQPDKNSNKVVVHYTVKNQGNASSEASITGISAGGKLIKHNTPPLDPGDTFSASCAYNLGKAGKYQIKARADYVNTNVEQFETNNENVLMIGIGRSF
jgi:subtilase family serine protease